MIKYIIQSIAAWFVVIGSITVAINAILGAPHWVTIGLVIFGIGISIIIVLKLMR